MHRRMKREAKDLLESAGYPKNGIFDELRVGDSSSRGYIDVAGATLDPQDTIYIECETDHGTLADGFWDKNGVKYAIKHETRFCILTPKGLFELVGDPEGGKSIPHALEEIDSVELDE